jgi:Methyltransferase domain
LKATVGYDEFAEWYEQWGSGMPPLIAAQNGLLPALTGDRVLDVGCGQGRMSRHLAGLGADVTGVDISAACSAGPAHRPCLPGSARGASSWPPGQGYEYEGWWISPEDHNPQGVRIRVGATHRKLSTYLNALLDAGLEAECFVEPPSAVPTYLLWRCRR